MDTQIKNKIEAKVKDLYEILPHNEFGLVEVPINLGTILEAYQLNAYDVDFTQPGISGAFVRNRAAIYLNKNDQTERKRFTLAHELGHYFLHTDMNEEILWRKGSDDPKEHEANYFASKLLTPADTVRYYWRTTKDIQRMADMFFVSYSTMLIRLQRLGLVQETES